MDWGLGHATRMVPVIEILKSSPVNLILGADNRPYDFLKQRFPDVEMVRFPGYVPHYPAKGSMALKMLSEMPDMLRFADKAHSHLEKFVKERAIDLVISDNRYELWSKHAKTVFVTHQLNVQTPKFGKVTNLAVRQIVYSFIRKHDELWIPDFEGKNNLSGKLSHVSKYPIDNHHFIGPLSRFQFVEPKPVTEPVDLLIILSGPEPQRTILEVKLKDQAYQTGLKTVILQGRPEEGHHEKLGNIDIYSHLPDEEIAGLIRAAKLVVSRPGYSTLMDLAYFGAQAVFIPTPGQTEQKYLAKYLKDKGFYYYQSQKTFDLEKALAEAANYKGLKMQNDLKTLKDRIAKLID